MVLIKRKLNFHPIENTNQDNIIKCDCCGSTKDLRICYIMTHSSDTPICKICFYLWAFCGIYDRDELAAASKKWVEEHPGELPG